jgi:V/A-type H+-transporting ATPase subunit D
MDVSATRMELLRLTRREAVARRGHKLLKDKLDELIRVMLERVREIEARRRDMGRIRDAWEGMMALAGQDGLPSAAPAAWLCPSVRVGIGVGEQRIMNLTVPRFTVIEGDRVAGYGVSQTSAALDRAGDLFLDLVRVQVDLAEKEKSVRILADEIAKTRRRVNALEYILIPDIVETRKHIAMALDERERDTRGQLMRIKDVIRAPLSPSTAFPGTAKYRP